jgi:hypothetical protein
MRKLFSVFIFILFGLGAYAQTEEQHNVELYESFKHDKELKAAFVKFDLTPFATGPVKFILDTVEKVVNIAEMNKLMKRYVSIPNNAQVRKASESNNGYTQTFGIYKGDDALTYVRITLSQEDGTLQEVAVEKNH